jgi:hypothetical protein
VRFRAPLKAELNRQSISTNRSVIIKESGEVVDEAKAALSLRSKPVMTNRFHLISCSLFGQMLLSILLTPVTWISMGIEAANHAPIENFNLGVIQV